LSPAVDEGVSPSEYLLPEHGVQTGFVLAVAGAE
jgi:hypothetical protein